MIEEHTRFDTVGVGSAGRIRVMRPFCDVVIGLRKVFNYILPMNMFQQNGLVDPMEVPFLLACRG